MSSSTNSNRNLSDADIKALAEALWKEILEHLATYTGKGVLGMAWKGILLIILLLAVYGYAHHGV
jgi:hypothetical protein